MYTVVMADIDLTVFKELFNSKFDALDSKLDAMTAVFQKENDRQDEAIERLADRTTHVNETRRLEQRIDKLESQMDGGRKWLNDINYKVKVTWAIGGIALALCISILTAIIKGWIGV